MFTVFRRAQSVIPNFNNPRILITGGLGQLGSGISDNLRTLFGRDNVLLTDIVKPSQNILSRGPFEFCDIMDYKNLQRIVVNNNIDWIIHFSAILSALGEKNVMLSMKINIEGLQNVMEVAKSYHLRLFVPSTIGAFGPTSPLECVPDVTIQQPTTIYGISKVHAELLGAYYHDKYQVDFRCLRLPGVLSHDSDPGGGTTDYAVHVFYHALAQKHFVCNLSADTKLPMIYIDDCLRGITEFMCSSKDVIKQRVYNLSAVNFTPEELFREIKLEIPSFTWSYEPDFRQAIADSWPKVLDDSNARKDWKWNHDFNLRNIVLKMLSGISKRI